MHAEICMVFLSSFLINFSLFFCFFHLQLNSSVLLVPSYPPATPTTSESTTPKPLLSTEEPMCNFGEYACADRTCLPSELFCDGEVDCDDQSDEGWCGEFLSVCLYGCM